MKNKKLTYNIKVPLCGTGFFKKSFQFNILFSRLVFQRTLIDQSKLSTLLHTIVISKWSVPLFYHVDVKKGVHDKNK